MPQHLDLRYGERPRNRIDFLSAGRDAPTLVFVHGGYWHMRSKETFIFAAQGPLESGINVALVGHTLAPEATLDGIVIEIRDAIDFLDGRLPVLGADPERLWVSGWSAGGHLAAMVLDHPRCEEVLRSAASTTSSRSGGATSTRSSASTCRARSVTRRCSTCRRFHRRSTCSSAAPSWPR
jgi:acetyl esterase/lipase